MISQDEIALRCEQIVREQRKLFAQYGITEERVREIFERPREFDEILRGDDGA